jgi:hypothetical protein
MTKFLWTQQSNFGPSPRSGGAMAFDSDRGRLVLFGGNTGTSRLGDTWEWDGGFWTQVEDIGPSPRFLSAMVYDAARKVCLLFGGRDSDEHFLGDTWQWDGIKWTQLLDSGPAGRSSHAMAFDIYRSRTVLFSGQAGPAASLADTWEFDGDNWTQQQDAGPAARGGHVMAFEDVSARTVLFGGTALDGSSFADTWAWDGNEWVQIAEFGPSARLETAIASTQDGNLILYGGLKTIFSNILLSDTWQFDGKYWIQVQDIGPGPLHEAMIAFDNRRARVVVFGGIAANSAGTTSVSANTWELSVDPLKVASLSFADPLVAGTPLQLTVALNRPAPSSGAIVNFQGPIFTTAGVNLPPLTVPTGQRQALVTVEFAPNPNPSTISFSASVGDTPPLSITIDVAGH